MIKRFFKWLFGIEEPIQLIIVDKCFDKYPLDNFNCRHQFLPLEDELELVDDFDIDYDLLNEEISNDLEQKILDNMAWKLFVETDYMMMKDEKKEKSLEDEWKDILNG